MLPKNPTPDEMPRRIPRTDSVTPEALQKLKLSIIMTRCVARDYWGFKVLLWKVPICDTDKHSQGTFVGSFRKLLEETKDFVP